MSTFVNQLSAAVRDLIQGARMAPIWASLGWDQTVGRFRRTVLGPFWLSSGVLMMAFALSFVFGGLFGAKDWRSNFAMVLTGIVTWSIVGGILGDAGMLFVNSGPLMQLQRLPLSFHVFLQLYRALVNFLAQLISAFVLLSIFGMLHVPHWSVLPAVVIVMFNSFMISLILAIPATRFRDLGYALGVGAGILFFCTPVFWRLEQMSPKKQFIVALNPLAHEVEIIRKPLLGEMPAIVDWEWTLATTVVTTMIALIVLALYRRRVVFWL